MTQGTILVRCFAYRFQRTLARPVDVPGVGLISGLPSRIRLRPADVNTGIVFIRSDLPGSPRISAHASVVTDTRRRTTLGVARATVTLTEHLLAALAGLRVDNCEVELSNSEPPGLDGSAGGFATAILDAGCTNQAARRSIFAVDQPITIVRNDATLSIHPTDTPNLVMSYTLDYGHAAPIARQTTTLTITPESFARELAHCRTFLLEAEVAQMRQHGIGNHLQTSDILVFGPQGRVSKSLHHADEPARHKMLDMVGDLSLCGFDLAGHIVAYRSGHAMNVELAQHLAASANPMPEARETEATLTGTFAVPYCGVRRAA